MLRTSLKSVSLIAASLALLLASVIPVAATTVSGKGQYARFAWNAEDGAIVIVDKLNGSGGRLSLSASGLLASHEYFVIGRSVNCSGPTTAATRVFKVRFVSDAQGYGWVAPKAMQFNVNISSIWITADGPPGPDVCSPVKNFDQVAGDNHAQGALGIWDKEHVLSVVERRPNSVARLSISFGNDTGGGDQLSLIGSGRACGKSAGAPSYKVVLEDVLVTGYQVIDVALEQNLLDSLKSFRIRNETQGKNLGCAPLSIIAILIGL